MSYRSRLSLCCLGLGMATALVACNTQLPASNPAQPHPAPTVAPVLCAPVTSDTPAELQKKTGYQQVALSVMNESGREVQNLGKDDFVIKRGDKTFPVEFAEYVTNGPASVLILVDTSGSTAPKLPQTREAVTQVVNSLDPRDDVALVAFSGKPLELHSTFELQSFTRDPSLILEREKLLNASGSTTLFDGVLDATVMLLRGCYARRVLVVISDGMENNSSSSLANATDHIRSGGISAYGIAIGRSDTSSSIFSSGLGPFVINGNSVDEKSLGLLTNPTGGSTFRIAETGDTALLAAAAKSKMESSHGQ